LASNKVKTHSGILYAIRSHLSVKVFLITFLVQIIFGALIIGVLFFSSPRSYNTAKQDIVEGDFQELLETMRESAYENAGPVVDAFIKDTGADVLIYNVSTTTDGKPLLTALNSVYAVRTYDEFEKLMAQHENSYYFNNFGNFRFQNTGPTYRIEYYYFVDEGNTMTTAIRKSLPVIIAAIVIVSLLCAYIYTVLFAKPIKKLSMVSRAMAELDFSKKSASKRVDEIGALSRDLDSMSSQLDEKITELKKRTVELEEEIKRVNELESQKDVFFSAASHELKTPVTVLEGQIRGMIDGIEPYSDHDTYLPKALGTVKRMESLINEILTASRMQSGKEIVIARTDMAQILEEKMEECEELFSSRGLKMELNIENDLVFEGNKELTSLAVGAFISNAAFYSSEGAVVEVDGEKDEKVVRVLVRNTGARIDEEDLTHLFEPFYRTDKSRSRRSGGSGLGLYLAKLILEKQGGSCRLENRGNDVLATVELPVAGASVTESAEG
jgi:Signal transduction histidine kinase